MGAADKNSVSRSIVPPRFRCGDGPRQSHKLTVDTWRVVHWPPRQPGLVPGALMEVTDATRMDTRYVVVGRTLHAGARGIGAGSGMEHRFAGKDQTR